MYRRPATSDGAVRSAVRRVGRTARSVLPGPDTPLTLVVLVVFGVTNLALRWSGPADADVMQWASTNLVNLHRHPAAAMLASIFVSPVAVPSDLMVLAAAGAVLERRAGPLRVAVIALLGHVIATLVTEGAVWAAIWSHVELRAAAWQLDIGISYVAITVAAAALCYITWPWRAAALAGLAVWVLVPLAEHPDLAGSGHVLSMMIGLTCWHWLPVPADARATTPARGRPGTMVRRYRGDMSKSPSAVGLVALASCGLLTVGLGALSPPSPLIRLHSIQHVQHKVAARHAVTRTSLGSKPRHGGESTRTVSGDHRLSP